MRKTKKIMTYSDFEFFNTQVESLVNKVLDSVRDKSFSDYVLLLARGGYQVEFEKTTLSPYVVSSRQEIYLDRSRKKFLVNYLNTYATILRDNNPLENEYKEYDLHIQMMIYAQIWESHRFLKTLIRISEIMTGKTYKWRIQFEELKGGKAKPIPKGIIIKEQILEPLNTGCPEFAQFIKNIYDGDLRNDFAHSSYYINIKDNAIISMNSELYSKKKKTGLSDWEQMFIYSALLSYYLLIIINNRLNSFKKDYPNLEFVEIEWPSYIEPDKMHPKQLIPVENKWGVEFKFR